MVDRKNIRVSKRLSQQIYRSRAGAVKVRDFHGGRLVEYMRDGVFDYDTYRDIQVAGNKAKINAQWVGEDHIRLLSDYINLLRPEISFGLCHGTRSGAEQMWFSQHLSGNPFVLGTDISDTAADRPQSIVWDFHNIKPEWIDAADFVYSNSWDHSYDPLKAFHAWAKCLKPGGMMLLDHAANYEPDKINVLDPFGIAIDDLENLIKTELMSVGKVIEVITGAPHGRIAVNTLIFQKHEE